MRRGPLVGAIAGGLLALGIGYALAAIPTTPTWTLWRIKRALDRDDVAELRQLVDAPQAAARALGELVDPSESQPRRDDGIDIGGLLSAVLGGGKVYTVFNDPERPLRLGVSDFVAAWWSIRRDGEEAQLSLDVDGRPISLVFARAGDGGWKVVGVTPLSALIRVKPPR